MTHFWRNHSLTIVLSGFAIAFLAVSALLPEGKWFDFVLGLGHFAVGGALLNWLSGPFRERNKPES